MTPDRIKEEVGFFKAMFIIASAMSASVAGYLWSNVGVFNFKIMIATFSLLAFCVIMLYCFTKMKLLIKKL